MVGDLSNLLLVSAANRGSASPYSKPLVEARNGPQICRLKIDKSWNGTNWSACIPKVCIESIAEVCRSQHLSTSDRHPQFSEVDLPPGFTVFSLFLVSFQVLKVIIILTFQLDIPLPASQPSFPQAFRVHRWILSLDLETTRTTSAGSSHFWRSKLQHTEKKMGKLLQYIHYLTEIIGIWFITPTWTHEFLMCWCFFNEVSPGILQHIQEDMTYIIALS